MAKLESEREDVKVDYEPELRRFFPAQARFGDHSANGSYIQIPLAENIHDLLIVAALGLFLAVMAGLQARPGAGFWQGSSYGQPGSLAAMVQSMSRTPPATAVARTIVSP